VGTRAGQGEAEALAGAGVGVEELVLGCEFSRAGPLTTRCLASPSMPAEASRRWRRNGGPSGAELATPATCCAAGRPYWHHCS